MRHEPEVVHEICFLLGWVRLEVLELFSEYAIVHLELFLVVVRLPLDSILELCESHLLFVLVH